MLISKNRADSGAESALNFLSGIDAATAIQNILCSSSQKRAAFTADKTNAGNAVTGDVRRAILSGADIVKVNWSRLRMHDACKNRRC